MIEKSQLKKSPSVRHYNIQNVPKIGFISVSKDKRLDKYNYIKFNGGNFVKSNLTRTIHKPLVGHHFCIKIKIWQYQKFQFWMTYMDKTLCCSRTTLQTKVVFKIMYSEYLSYFRCPWPHFLWLSDC